MRVAPIDASVATGGDGAWQGEVTAASVKRQMRLIGNQTVLDREEGDLVIWTVNPQGNTTPYDRGGRYHKGCRLAAAAPLVQKGIADIVVLPEAHADANGARAAASYVARHCAEGTRVLSAPTSRMAAAIELDGEAVKASSHSGILVLLAPAIAERLVGTPDHRHFVAGRLLHFKLAFPEGVVNIIAVYGVSSPTSTARKAWTSATLASELRRVVTTLCGDEAVLIVGDMNVVPEARDRRVGKLQSYDSNAHALWRVLGDVGAVDAWRQKLPDLDAFSYVQSGEPCSRIDQAWLNDRLLQWCGSDGSGLRVALTETTEPLSPDHRSLVLRLPPWFTREAGGEGLCTAISAVPKCVRAAMDEERAERYRWEVAAPRRQLAEQGNVMSEVVAGWPTVRHALDLLNLDTEFNGTQLTAAAARVSGLAPADDVGAALQVLRGLVGTDDKADLRERRTQARAAASAFIRHSVREMGDALGMAREATRGAAAPKPHGKKPDVSCEALHKLLGLVAVAAADDRAEAKKKLRQEVARLVAGEVTVLPAAPWPGADDAEWAAWAAVAMPHALGMLAQAGHSQRGNVAITPPSGPSVGQGSLRLDLEQMMESMGPTNGGGAIDALLAEYDPDTGERMPCLTHDGLSKLVRETVAGWSADKAHGKHAYAYTSAMDGAIFDVEEDARGLRRNSTTTEAETRRRVAEKAAELRQLADSCRQLGATEADASRLQAALDTAAAEKLRATPAQQASVRYLAATPGQRDAAVAAWEALDSGLPEERRLERAMAAAEADMGETQPTAAPVPRGSAVGAVVLEAEEVIGAAEASTPGTAAAASAALASLKCHVEVWHKDSSMRGGAMVEGVVTGSDGACAVVESKTLSKPKKCAVDALRPPPPPPPTGWADELQAGDEVDMRSGCVWWPMRVMGKSGGLWRLRNDAYAASERDPVKPIAKLRPRWHWHADANDHSYSLKRSGERRVAALQLETGGKARVVGSGGEHDGRVAVLRERQEGGQWRARDGRSRRELIVHESLLQPTEAAPPPVEPRTAEAAAREQVERWLNVTATEAEAIAASLETHAETLRQALMPREVSSPQEAAWRDARRNYADVDELRAALMAMAPGKTGASIGLEQLRVLTKAEDHILAPWLVITEMFFAGEVPDELKLGVVSPLAKDEEKFRPVVLLEPLYKVCMATMSSRVLNSLHKYGLLDSAQFGFVRDGSCHDPLKVMARLYERGRGADGEELHVAFLDATSAFDSVPHAVLDAALRRLGAPPDFISWIRAVLSGHRRKAVTAYETDADDEAIELEGGAPQGCPSSPLVWTILADYALAVMRAERGDDAVDVQFGGEVLRCLAFADDLAVAAKTREGLRARVQMLVAAMGAVGVRFNSRKSYYAWSAAAARRHQLDPAEAPADLLEVDVLDADGRWRRAALTSVPPVGDVDGETLPERGAARYLGV